VAHQPLTREESKVYGQHNGGSTTPAHAAAIHRLLSYVAHDALSALYGPEAKAAATITIGRALAGDMKAVA
jgi:hypothetical protein